MKRSLLACALMLGMLSSHAQSSHVRFHALPETSYYGGIHSIATDSLGRLWFSGADGWCLGHNSDIWAMTCPVGLGSGDPSWANWNLGGAWLATHVWEHWLFTRNRADLQRDYPRAERCGRILHEHPGRKGRGAHHFAGHISGEPVLNAYRMYRRLLRYVKGLRTRTGETVDLAWKHGKVTRLEKRKN